ILRHCKPLIVLGQINRRQKLAVRSPRNAHEAAPIDTDDPIAGSVVEHPRGLSRVRRVDPNGGLLLDFEQRDCSAQSLNRVPGVLRCGYSVKAETAGVSVRKISPEPASTRITCWFESVSAR